MKLLYPTARIWECRLSDDGSLGITPKCLSMLFVSFEEMPDGGACIVATDGRVVASAPVERQEGDVFGLLPAEALDLAADYDDRDPGGGSIECGAEAVTVRLAGRSGVVVKFARPDVAQPFPDWRRAIQSGVPKAGEIEAAVSFDPEYLSKIVAALDVRGVELRFASGGAARRYAPISVRSISGEPNAPFAHLMPVERSE